MGRAKILELTSERKKQIDSRSVSLLDTADVAYLLRVNRRTVQTWVREKPEFRSISKRHSKRGEIFFNYDELIEYLSRSSRRCIL